MKSGFSLSPNTFATLFPFYFTFDRDLLITNAGQGLQRIYPDITEIAKVKDFFAIEEPAISYDFENIQFHQNLPFLLLSTHNDLKFKGQMVNIDPQLMLFLGSPIVENINRVDAYSLKYNDLLTRDLSDDILFKMEMQSIALEKAKRESDRLARNQIEFHKKLIEEQELSELKTRFINTASHEFRTPLGIISSSSGLLEDYGHKLDDTKRKKHFRQIQNSVKHMTSLLEDILFVNQADAGKISCQKIATELITLCQEIVEDLTTAKNAEGRISMTISPVQIAKERDSPIYIDPKLIRQILINLLSNALKYSFADSQVRFDITIDPKSITFQVSDRGIGITEEDRAKLFGSFNRGSNVSNIQGTGLGLSIVKRCVDMHGGSIDFTSEVNVGTTFTVKIPIDTSS